MPISPNSLTMTAVAAIPGRFSTWFKTVVLPLPRKPVSNVTGIRGGGSVEFIAAPGSALGVARSFVETDGSVECSGSDGGIGRGGPGGNLDTIEIGDDLGPRK